VERAEVVVLGMGPGGEDVAGRLADAGVDVVGEVFTAEGIDVRTGARVVAADRQDADLALAVHAEVSLELLRGMISAYPTFHRAVEYALRDLGDA
jgi:pyruvate/2-oxoglutarate dehydrogenase complex dihydrolipoamide dehydrogenase (E3) component